MIGGAEGIEDNGTEIRKKITTENERNKIRWREKGRGKRKISNE